SVVIEIRRCPFPQDAHHRRASIARRKTTRKRAERPRLELEQRHCRIDRWQRGFEAGLTGREHLCWAETPIEDVRDMDARVQNESTRVFWRGAPCGIEVRILVVHPVRLARLD